jgi:hypothetical protein
MRQESRGGRRGSGVDIAPRMQRTAKLSGRQRAAGSHSRLARAHELHQISIHCYITMVPYTQVPKYRPGRPRRAIASS